MPIAIEHLSYIYSPRTPYEKRALDDVTFTIEDGDFFGIVGQTGSGKSTLISHLNALTRVTQGRILVDDMDLSVKKLDFKRLRSTVGMVFQYPEYQLFDETVLADVMFGCKNIGMDDEAAEARAREAMAAVGLPDELAERSPFELSGGCRTSWPSGRRSSCRADRSAGRPSPASSPCAPKCWCSTSRRPASTRAAKTKYSILSARSRRTCARPS